jgi:hypothetical protein
MCITYILSPIKKQFRSTRAPRRQLKYARRHYGLGDGDMKTVLPKSVLIGRHQHSPDSPAASDKKP